MSPTPPGRARKARVTLLTLYAHPFELATAVLLGVSAVRTATRLESVLGILSPSAVYGWAIATVLGILGIVVGLFGSADLTGLEQRRRAAYRAIEKAGLYLTAGATATIAVLVDVALPLSEAWPSDVQLGAIVLACLLRAGAIRKAERITLEELRRVTATEYLDAIRHRDGHDRRHGDQDGRP